MPDKSIHTLFSDAPDASLTALGRVIGELRRGMAIVVRDGARALLVTAAESGIDPRALTLLTDGAVSCLITAARAEALGLDAAGAPMVAIAPQDGLDAGTVSAIIGEALDDAALRPDDAGPGDRFQEAALEIVKLARLLPAALSAPIGEDPDAFARKHDLMTVDAANVARYRGAAGALRADPVAATVPLEGAEDTKLIAFRPADGGKAHLAVVIGAPDKAAPVLARLHSECFTGDMLGSLRCDCGDQLRGAVAAIAEAGGGVLLYLAQEGRGIGLVNKLRAYRLQDNGFDTIEANEQLGFGADERVYAPAATILQRLGFTRIRLMTNNPGKVSGLEAHDIDVVERVPHSFPANGHNEQYLQTKAVRGGHLF